MIYRDHNYPEKINVAMRGGDGQVRVENLLSKEELYEKGRLFGRLTLEPGCSIGQHEHTGEMEAFYVVSGSGVFLDNGEERPVSAGDVCYTGSGEFHAIRNTGSDTMVLFALILYK